MIIIIVVVVDGYADGDKTDPLHGAPCDDGIKIKMVSMIKMMMMVITLTMMMMTKPTPCMVHPVMTV